MATLKPPSRSFTGTMGNRFWIRKIEEIENTINDFSPDIFLISEANIFDKDLEHETRIEGYNIVHTKSIVTMKYSRLVMLVKDGLNIKIVEDLMDTEVASIWIKVNKQGARSLFLGGHIQRAQTPTSTSTKHFWHSSQPE